MRFAGLVKVASASGASAGASAAAAAEPVRLDAAALDAVTAGRWQGYAVAKIGASASGGAQAATQTRNAASFRSTYQETNGTETGSTVNVSANASGSASGSGPGPSSAGVGGFVIISASRVPS